MAENIPPKRDDDEVEKILGRHRFAGQVMGARKARAMQSSEPPPVTSFDAFGHTSTAPPADAGDALVSIRASAVKLSAIEWLWPNRFALGKLGLLVGLPEEGKGQVFAYMAAQITRHGKWPCDEGTAPDGNVVVLTAEDDLNDTLVPRYLAAGADLERIEIIRMVRRNNENRMFSLVTDLKLLRQKILAVGNVKMVQIDPISAYLGVGKIDSFRTTDVRAVLGPLVELAAELGVFVGGVLHFNKKVDVTNALLRISDSLAFGAAARHVYAVIDDPGNKRKLMVRAKNNLASMDTKALAFSFSNEEVGKDHKTGKPIRAPYIIWHPEHVDVTASEAMAAATEGRAPSARDEAQNFLLDLLADGPMLQTEIEEAARANVIAIKTLRRAKADLKIRAAKDHGKGGPWRWSLPQNSARWHGLD
jgi:hypothetical protein